MLDKLLNDLAARGISIIDMSIATNDPLDTRLMPQGYLVNVTLNIPMIYSRERILVSLLRAALTEVQSQDKSTEA